MAKNLRTYLSFLLCLVFIARIVAVNVDAVTSAEARQTSIRAKGHMTAAMSRRRHFEVPADTKSCGHPILEICEENDNEETQLKSLYSFVVQTLSSFYNDTVRGSLAYTSFQKAFSYTSCGRYLALRVVRV